MKNAKFFGLHGMPKLSRNYIRLLGVKFTKIHEARPRELEVNIRLFGIFLIVIMFLCSNILVTSAWTEPTASPPGSNVAAPLNIGSTDQYKAGNIAIGTDSANSSYQLYVSGEDAGGAGYLRIKGTTGNEAYLNLQSGSQQVAQIYQPASSDELWFWVAGANQMVIDDSGNVGIGVTNPSEIFEVRHSGGSDTVAKFVSEDGSGYLDMYAYRNDTHDNYIRTYGSRGTLSAPLALQGSENILYLNAYGYDGFNFQEAAQIRFSADGGISAGDMPGKISFWTTLDGSSTVSERMRITNSGNVGIGTTGPDTLLHISGDATAILQLEDKRDAVGTGQVGSSIHFLQNDSSVAGQQGVGAKIDAIYTDGSGRMGLAFSTGGLISIVKEQMRIDQIGNVGIGTTTPDAKLTIGSGDANPEFKIYGDDSGTDKYGKMWVDTSGYYNFSSQERIMINPYGANKMTFYQTSARIMDDYPLTFGSGGDFSINYISANDILSIYDTGGGAGTGITINGSGYVGIGVTNPDSLLEVSDSTAANIHVGGPDVGLYLSQTGGASPALIGHNVKAVGASDFDVAATHASFGYRAIKFEYDTDDRGIQFYTYRGSVTAGDALGNERMRITNTGYVGIGTTGPGEKLEVVGNVKLTGAVPTLTLDATSDPIIDLDKGSVAKKSHIEFSTASTNSWYLGTPDSDIAGDGTELYIGRTIAGGGIPALWIETGGNVGIGYTNPQTKLSVMQQTDLCPGDTAILGHFATTALVAENAIGLSALSSGVKSCPIYPSGRIGLYAFGDEFGIYSATGINYFNGYVGIGTSGPGYGLDVQGPTTPGNQINAAGGLCIDGDCKTDWSAIDGDWTISGNDIYSAVSDNVGIGTASPKYKLEVAGGSKIAATSSAGHAYMYHDGSSTSYLYTDDSWILFAAGGNERFLATGDFTWEDRDDGNEYRMKLYSATGHLILRDSSENINIQLHPGGITYFNGGNVGIGTTAPGEKLEVSGAGDTYIKVSTDSGNEAGIKFREITTDRFVLTMDGSDNTLQLQTLSNVLLKAPYNVNELYLVPNGGNVGIGTTGPLQKLTLWDGDFGLTDSGDLASTYRIKSAEWKTVGPVGLSHVHSMDVYDGALYSGSYDGHIYRYDGGTSWTDVSPDIGPEEYWVQDLAVYNGKLYAGRVWGEVWRYDGGTTWTKVTPAGGMGGDIDQVNGLAVYNGSLYAAKDGGHVYRYDGLSDWTDMGDVGTGNNRGLILYDGELYVCNSDDSIYRFSGKGWTTVGTLGYGCTFNGMSVYNGDLYIAIYDNNIYRYDPEFSATTWTSVGQPSIGVSAWSKLIAYNGSLYAGLNDGAVYRYNGKDSWSNMGSSGTMSMTVYNSQLYVGKQSSVVERFTDWLPGGRLEFAASVGDDLSLQAPKIVTSHLLTRGMAEFGNESTILKSSSENLIYGNICDTSASESNLLLLQNQSTDKFSVDKDGQVYTAGNVGIGTTGPNSQLHVYDTGTNAEIDIQSVAGSDNHWAIYHDSSSDDLRFWADSADRVTFSDNGDVLIGTTTPVSGLFGRYIHMSNDNLTNRTIGRYDSLLVEDDEATIQLLSDDASSWGPQLLLSAAPQAGGDNKWWGMMHMGPTESNRLSFSYGTVAAGVSQLMGPTAGGGLASEKFVIQTDGKVGIGTTSPQEELDVLGTGYFRPNVTGDSAIALRLGSRTDPPSSLFDIYTDDVTGDTVTFDINRWTGDYYFQRDSDNGSQSMAYIGGGDTSHFFKLYDQTTATAKVQFDSNGDSYFNTGGNVGIGVTNPMAMLDIYGVDTTDRPIISIRQSNNYAYGFDWDLERISVGRLDLYVVNASARTQALSVLRTDGKVGIGTTSPQAKLDVSGNIKIGSDSTACSNASHEGELRYYVSGSTSNLVICMQTGAGFYGWYTIKQYNWGL